MNEFDKFIKFQIPILIKKWNLKRNTNEYTNEAHNIRRRMSRLKNSILPIIQDPYQITKIPISFEDRITIYKSISEFIPENEKLKQLIVKNLNSLDNTPTQDEINMQATYEKHRKNRKKLLEDYLPQEQVMIKKMNARAASFKRVHDNIQKLIITYGLEIPAAVFYIDYIEKKIKLEKSQQLKSIPFDPNKKKIGYRYYRYADDWILFVRGSIRTTKILKKIIEKWINFHLKLQLSPEKTLITNLHEEKAHFLGYEIFHQRNKQVVKRKTIMGPILQRYGKIQIMPDIERLKKKFKIINILTDKEKILSIGSLTPLQDHQIIEKFNQFMLGLGIYYITEISRVSALNRWHYILYYACLKTLSHRHRSSVAQIMNKGYLDISNDSKKKIPQNTCI